jgi:CheY-like chemotaxis protein
VENDEAVRKMLEMALQQAGFCVLSAVTGADAIRLYEQHRDTIAVVLLDVQMPGLDGVQTLAAIRDLNPQVRVVFMSGSSGDYSSEELVAAGAFCVLQKPFRSLAYLVSVLHQAADGGAVGE